MDEEQSFLGTGWSFPPTFDPAQKGVVMVSGIEDICQSLTILFDTALGERVMQPKYGSNLDSMVMEPINNATLTYIDDIVRTAIIYHEPRIKLIRLEVSDENQLEGVLKISVIFEVRSTNTRFNFVYPFYIQEGTDI
ncbi:GPW/gp25 family protein [Negadavirga shengliensis]|uniref:GPW/gp25 family protein n=1 Tax=Negadavirga shengliensis TaxID=1389218 RepID=A0ABV9T628_9BACT